jgi:CHAD domain-containing protein
VKARPVDGLDPGGTLRANAVRIISTRLDELRGFADAALAPKANAAQHDMRIAAKRLRYVLEIVVACIGPEADAAREACKRLQSALGDLHDCDLMLQRTEGVASAAAVLQDRREHLFHEFVALWQAEASRGTWAALERSL